MDVIGALRVKEALLVYLDCFNQKWGEKQQM